MSSRRDMDSNASGVVGRANAKVSRACRKKRHCAPQRTDAAHDTSLKIFDSIVTTQVV